jgi:Sec-independent protein translocase protein TatA
MFGIGLGEILLIMFIIFMISPRDLPRVMRKAGEFFRELDRIKKDLTKIRDDMDELTSGIHLDEKKLTPGKLIDEKDLIDNKKRDQRKNKDK